MSMNKLILWPGILLLMVFCCSCSGDKKDAPEIIPDPKPVEEEVKEDVFYGQWELSREDNGISITTIIKMSDDYSCSYEQTIEKNPEEVYTIGLSGKWLYDKDASRLSFTLMDDESNELIFSAMPSADHLSFKIEDEYSAMDDYFFEKTEQK